MFWEELDDYPEVIQSSFSYVRAVSSDCLRLIGVWFRVSEQSVFEYDIVFDGKRERVSQIEVAFSSSCFGKIMFGFTYLWWGCDYYDNLGITMFHKCAYLCV